MWWKMVSLIERRYIMKNIGVFRMRKTGVSIIIRDILKSRTDH